MDDRSLRVLDFFHLLDLLKEYSVSPLGRKRCEALRPSTDLLSIQSRLTEVLELKEIIETVSPPPLSGLNDVEGILDRLAVEDSVLTVEEVLEMYGQMVLCNGVKRFFDHLEGPAYPHLQQRVSRLTSLKSIEKEILRAVNTKGEILDTASPNLSEIREQLRSTREKARGALDHLLHREELQPIFQEQLVTVRNGRYVVLVKSEHKHRMQGIVHDQSQSRMTFFFEPLQVVSLNNDISILTGEEKEEEYRILADLSRSLRAELETLRSNLEIQGELDFLYALARFSILLKSVDPAVAGDGRIEMKGARHPLLVLQGKDPVVPVDLRLGNEARMLIVSGANAGGKTVALKTLGLLTVMVQCGIPIPVAEGSRASTFEGLFAMIGDEQDIGENLSTFSSHLLHLNQILEEAGPRSLILLDELGVGTDAAEGCALAMAFLDQLRERGCTVVVTTHFDRLKLYGYLHPEVANVAVEFDSRTLEPKFTLAYGSSGLSNAFLIAEKMGFSKEALNRAREYQTGVEQEVMHSLETLEHLKAAARKDRQLAAQAKADAEQERQQLRETLDRIKAKKQEIFAQTEEKARKTAQAFEEELKEWSRRLKEERKAASKVLPLRSHRKEIQEIKERSFPSRKTPGPAAASGELQAGDRVRVGGLRQPGVLVKVEKPSKRGEVVIGDRRVKVALSEITRIRDEGKQEEHGGPERMPLTDMQADEAVSTLNIIGLTIDEALPVVDKFIDQALVHGLEKLQIIHGIGSGRLRSAVGAYLREHKRVKGYALGDPMKGGGGVTFVDLS